jgi:hypothetical protein
VSVSRNKTNVISYLLPRLQDVLFVSLFVAVIGLGPRMFNVDGDLGRHITIGEYILETREIPTTDIFSHTMFGEPLTPHEWASQLVFGLMHRVAGLGGVVWLCALLIAVTFSLVYQQCVRQSGMVLVSLGISILAAASSSLHWLTRPHLFTILFVVVWVYGLEWLRSGKPVGWWYFPIVMLFWVNFHGAYIAGFVLWGIYLVGEVVNHAVKMDATTETEAQPIPSLVAKIKSYLIVGGSSLLATILNPSGWHVWKTSVGYLGNRYLVSHTAEYLPPNFHDPSTWPFLIMVILSIILLGMHPRKVSAISLLMLAGWTAMSLYSVRNVPLYAVLVAPILSEIAASEINTSKGMERFSALQIRIGQVESTLRGFLWPSLFVLLLGFALFKGIVVDFDSQGNEFSEAVFPVDAVGWMGENQQSGRIFNYFPWGGYLLYRSWPSELVFIDGQTDFYGEALTREYEQVITLYQGWEAVLDKYQVSRILMPSDSLLVKELKSGTAWTEVYKDTTASILVQSP